MNELEMLMIAESKKKSIDEDVIKRAQKEEYEKARKAMEDKGLNTLESYKHSLDCDDFQISVSDSFYHISDNEGDTWDNFDIVEQELK